MLGLIDRLAGLYMDWRTTSQAEKSDIEHDLELKDVDFDGDRLQMVLAHPALLLLAQETAVLLEELGGPNYLEIDMQPRIDKSKRPMRVTIQFAEGISPARKAIQHEETMQALYDILAFIASIRNDNTNTVEFLKEVQNLVEQGQSMIHTALDDNWRFETAGLGYRWTRIKKGSDNE